MEEKGPEMPIPDWLNALIRLGTISGIAVFLIWKGTALIENEIIALVKNQQSMHQLLLETQDQLGRHQMLTESWISISRQICINTAKNEGQARECGK